MGKGLAWRKAPLLVPLGITHTNKLFLFFMIRSALQWSILTKQNCFYPATYLTLCLKPATVICSQFPLSSLCLDGYSLKGSTDPWRGEVTTPFVTSQRAGFQTEERKTWTFFLSGEVTDGPKTHTVLLKKINKKNCVGGCNNKLIKEKQQMKEFIAAYLFRAHMIGKTCLNIQICLLRL